LLLYSHLISYLLLFIYLELTVVAAADNDDDDADDDHKDEQCYNKYYSLKMSQIITFDFHFQSNLIFCPSLNKYFSKCHEYPLPSGNVSTLVLLIQNRKINILIF